MCSAAVVVGAGGGAGGGVLHIRTPPRNSPWAFSITVRPELHTVMFCCFKAVTLAQGGTNVIRCGADPLKLLSHGMATRRGDAEETPASLCLFCGGENTSPAGLKGHVDSSEGEAPLRR